jgi:hypothetical protein
VPAVRAQPWERNYVDGSCGIRTNDEDYDLNDPEIPNRAQVDRGNCSNIEDNPMHPTMPDELVGELLIVETRRAKYVAVSTLTPDLLDTTAQLDAFEGELEDMDMDSLIQSYGQFDWSIHGNGHPRSSTYSEPLEAPDDFNFKPRLESEARFHQYQTHYNDRAFYSLSCVIDGTCPVNFANQLVDPEIDAPAVDPAIDWATSTANYHPEEPPAWTIDPEDSWDRRKLGARPTIRAFAPPRAPAVREQPPDGAPDPFAHVRRRPPPPDDAGPDPFAHIRRRPAPA